MVVAYVKCASILYIGTLTAFDFIVYLQYCQSQRLFIYTFNSYKMERDTEEATKNARTDKKINNNNINFTVFKFILKIDIQQVTQIWFASLLFQSSSNNVSEGSNTELSRIKIQTKEKEKEEKRNSRQS